MKLPLHHRPCRFTIASSSKIFFLHPLIGTADARPPRPFPAAAPSLDSSLISSPSREQEVLAIIATVATSAEPFAEEVHGAPKPRHASSRLVWLLGDMQMRPQAPKREPSAQRRMTLFSMASLERTLRMSAMYSVLSTQYRVLVTLYRRRNSILPRRTSRTNRCCLASLLVEWNSALRTRMACRQRTTPHPSASTW